MHPVRKQRLFLVLFLVILSSAVIGLVTFALRENINLFYPPAKLVSGDAPVDVQIRGGGCVKPGSVKRATDSLQVSFVMTDGAEDVTVKFEGILPDLFDEGEAVVATGKWRSDGYFEASEVLAKHDETYTPPEVQEAVQQGQGHSKACDGMGFENMPYSTEEVSSPDGVSPQNPEAIQLESAESAATQQGADQ